MEYESVFSEENSKHLKRHLAPDVLNIGSQFTLSEDNAEKLLSDVERRLKEYFDNTLAKGETPGRLEIQIEEEYPVGTDALVDLSKDSIAPFSMIRDEGTKNAREVNAVLANDLDIPRTNIVTVIAGPYGPTGVWGIYTLFPGEAGQPFPNEHQPDDVRAGYEEYWNTHGFLVTPETVGAHIGRYHEKIQAIQEHTAMRAHAAWGGRFDHYPPEEQEANKRCTDLRRALEAFKGQEKVAQPLAPDFLQKNLG